MINQNDLLVQLAKTTNETVAVDALNSYAFLYNEAHILAQHNPRAQLASRTLVKLNPTDLEKTETAAIASSKSSLCSLIEAVPEALRVKFLHHILTQVNSAISNVAQDKEKTNWHAKGIALSHMMQAIEPLIPETSTVFWKNLTA